MPRSATSEQDAGGAGNVEPCEITLYLHSAGFEQSAKQRAAIARPSLAEYHRVSQPIVRHVSMILSTCRADGWGRVALWVYAAELVKGSKRVGLERGAASAAAHQTSNILMA